MLKNLIQQAKGLLVLALAGILPVDYLNSFSSYLGQNDEADDTNPVISARRHPVRTSTMSPDTTRPATPHPHLHLNSRKGFSLVELMVVVAILGILLAICAGNGGGCVTANTRAESAERNAMAFSSQMKWEVQAVVCSGIDSGASPDGYVSCTVGLNDGTTKALNCGYDAWVAPLGQNTMCKMAMPMNFNVTGQ